jgi:hypothetical protein
MILKIAVRLSLLTLLAALLGFSRPAQAQSITFLGPSGNRVSSWKDGDRITVVVQGGGANAKWVDIIRQTGYAGATPVAIYSGPYSAARGLRYTFTAYYPGYVSITAQAKISAYGSWIVMATLWKNQR